MSRPEPDMRFHSIGHVPVDVLRYAGIKVLLFDVDNTCALRKFGCLTNEAIDLIMKAKAAGMTVVLVSNVVSSKRRIERVRKMAYDNDVAFVCATFPRLKPHPAPYQEAMSLADAKPNEACMIGDQLFTDVKGAKRLGMMAILVDPLGSDHLVTTPRRLLQNLALRKVAYT